MQFIEWCNNNMGFVSLLLSALTLFVSIIAVVVSVRTAKLPYKKKLMVSSGNYISQDGLGMHVTVTNVGNRKVKMKKMGILIGEIVYTDKNRLLEGHIDLNQGDETSHYFRLDEMQNLIRVNKIDKSDKMIAYVEDTEGKKYKKKICKVKDILNM